MTTIKRCLLLYLVKTLDTVCLNFRLETLESIGIRGKTYELFKAINVQTTFHIFERIYKRADDNG